MRYIKFVFIVCYFLNSQVINTQEQPKDSLQKVLPKLEIPEITIVGKKAITLPFARKGEIYDVNIYQAPPPDSSLIGQRSAIFLPIASPKPFKEDTKSFNLTSKLLYASYTTYDIDAYLSYKKDQFGSLGKAEFYSSEGHTLNSASKVIDLGLNAYYLINTDNDFLNKLKALAGVEYKIENYGMFGIRNSSIKRKRNNFDFNIRLKSVQEIGNSIDLSFTTKLWKIKDSKSFIDSQTVSLSPELKASFSTSIGNSNFVTELSYLSSFLDYSYSTQTPFLLSLTSMLNWQIENQWALSIGGLVTTSEGMKSNSEMFIRPFASLTWKYNTVNEFSVWYKPLIQLFTYDENIKRYPFLIREFDLEPEKIPLCVGAKFSYNTKIFSLEIGGKYENLSNKSVVIADSGSIMLWYTEANYMAIDIAGIFKPTERLSLKYSTLLQKCNQKDTDKQLPMIPIIQFNIHGEYDFNFPVNLWSSVKYTAKQNVDIDGKRALRDYVLLDGGIKYQVISNILLLFDVTNILNSAYEWWEFYTARGRQFKLEVKVNLL